MEQCILALDQGTTSSRAILFTKTGKILAAAHKEFTQIFPRPGWVEHDPQEILDSQLEAARTAIKKACLDPSRIAALGITNQRETVLLWEKDTGKPVYNAIVWQCRRSSAICTEWERRGYAQMFKEKTGLLIDPYFSASKICWLLEEVPGLRKQAQQGKILCGTVDSWLIYHLSGRHVTDYTNASRTLLFNIHTGKWDEDILRELKVPAAMLPEVVCSSGVIGRTRKGLLPAEIPVAGVAGDQQAALFGQTCFAEGDIKNTYGTGCFALINTGREAVTSQNRLLTTIAWDLGEGIHYALEGSIFIAGATVQWLRDQLGLIESAAETAEIAASVADTGGVYFVPAFVGLGAPHWDTSARGLICGLTRGSSRAQLVRAALESIAFQTYDLLTAIKKDTGRELAALKVDGGAAMNDFLMQFQADLLGIEVQRPVVYETTALGAAYLAGLGVGLWSGPAAIRSHAEIERVFRPRISAAKRTHLLEGWQDAIGRTLTKKS